MVLNLTKVLKIKWVITHFIVLVSVVHPHVRHFIVCDLLKFLTGKS